MGCARNRHLGEGGRGRWDEGLRGGVGGLWVSMVGGEVVMKSGGGDGTWGVPGTGT